MESDRLVERTKAATVRSDGSEQLEYSQDQEPYGSCAEGHGLDGTIDRISHGGGGSVWSASGVSGTGNNVRKTRLSVSSETT